MRLGPRRQLGHPTVIVLMVIIPRSRSRLVSVSIRRMLWVELVSRPVADLAVLFPVTVVRVGSGFHWNVGCEGIGGFVEAGVAGSVGSLSFTV
jgi:hypothetical protein